MNQQERFEEYYADQHGVTKEAMVLNRMGDTYRMPGLAAHYRTFKGAEGVTSQAAHDVLAERLRQMTAEGWSLQHDDDHDGGDLAAAASAYALYAADELNPQSQGDGDFGRATPPMWPFSRRWWKPEDPRRALVKAGALILAEIERIDRQDTGK